MGGSGDAMALAAGHRRSTAGGVVRRPAGVKRPSQAPVLDGVVVQLLTAEGLLPWPVVVGRPLLVRLLVVVAGWRRCWC
jgi:hypothetical protein